CALPGGMSRNESMPGQTLSRPRITPTRRRQTDGRWRLIGNRNLKWQSSFWNPAATTSPGLPPNWGFTRPRSTGGARPKRFKIFAGAIPLFWPCRAPAPKRRLSRSTGALEPLRQSDSKLQQFLRRGVRSSFSIDPQDRFRAGSAKHEPGPVGGDELDAVE